MNRRIRRYTPICPICGRMFDAMTDRAMFCSDRCRKDRAANLARQRPPEVKRAHAIYRAAIVKRELVPQPCEICGRINVHGHHDDYSKPLDVRWLCELHHRQHHGNEERARTRA